jgi:hypothetical protein
MAALTDSLLHGFHGEIEATVFEVALFSAAYKNHVAFSQVVMSQKLRITV